MMRIVWGVWCCRCLPQCLCNSRIPHERVHAGLWDQIQQYQMLRLATAKRWSYPPVKKRGGGGKCDVSAQKKMQICWWISAILYTAVNNSTEIHPMSKGQSEWNWTHSQKEERLNSRVTNALYTDSIDNGTSRKDHMTILYNKNKRYKVQRL